MAEAENSAPARAVDRYMAEVMGAVLHELRSSGADGLSWTEILHRCPGANLVAAREALLAEGRLRWNNVDGMPVLKLTACQRALDDANVKAYEDALASGRSILTLTRERDEARAAAAALRRGVEKALAKVDPMTGPWLTADIRACASKFQAALDGASAEGVALLERLDEAEEKARLWDAHGVSAARIAELQEAEENVGHWRGVAHFAMDLADKAPAVMVGARALSAIGHALEAHAHSAENLPRPADDGGELGRETLARVALDAFDSGTGIETTWEALTRVGVAVAHHTRWAIGRAVHHAALAAEKLGPPLYAAGLMDGSYLASYGRADMPPLETVRIVFQEGNIAEVLLLNDLGRDEGTSRFVMGSGHHGRMFADATGRVSSKWFGLSPVRVHPEDLAILLQSDRACDQHAAQHGLRESNCQQNTTGGVAAAGGVG